MVSTHQYYLFELKSDIFSQFFLHSTTLPPKQVFAPATAPQPAATSPSEANPSMHNLEGKVLFLCHLTLTHLRPQNQKKSPQNLLAAHVLRGGGATGRVDWRVATLGR